MFHVLAPRPVPFLLNAVQHMLLPIREIYRRWFYGSGYNRCAHPPSQCSSEGKRDKLTYLQPGILLEFAEQLESAG